MALTRGNATNEHGPFRCGPWTRSERVASRLNFNPYFISVMLSEKRSTFNTATILRGVSGVCIASIGRNKRTTITGSVNHLVRLSTQYYGRHLIPMTALATDSSEGSKLYHPTYLLSHLRATEELSLPPVYDMSMTKHMLQSY